MRKPSSLDGNTHGIRFPTHERLREIERFAARTDHITLVADDGSTLIIGAPEVVTMVTKTFAYDEIRHGRDS